MSERLSAFIEFRVIATTTSWFILFLSSLWMNPVLLNMRSTPASVAQTAAKHRGATFSSSVAQPHVAGVQGGATMRGSRVHTRVEKESKFQTVLDFGLRTAQNQPLRLRHMREGKWKIHFNFLATQWKSRIGAFFMIFPSLYLIMSKLESFLESCPKKKITRS